MTQGRFEGLGTAGQEIPSPDLNHELRTFLHSIIGYIELIQEDAAARGGRGLQGAATHTCLNSWDALGEWLMAAHEMENHFDVPIGKP